MAVTINGFTITSLETIHAYNRTTGVCELYLDELQEATIETQRILRILQVRVTDCLSRSRRIRQLL